MTSQACQMTLFSTSDLLTSSGADSLAKLFQLWENGKALPILEVLCSLKSLGSHLFSDLGFYSLKNVRGILNHEGGATFETILERWMDLGMIWNGKCLTLRPIFPKAVSRYSLSDILEPNVLNKYFLSQAKLNQLIKRSIH